MTMGRTMLLAIWLFASVSVGAAQTATPPAMDDKSAVLQTIDNFLDDLGALRIDAVAKHLTPDALIVVVRKRSEGMESTTTTGTAWLDRMKKAKTKFEEPIHNVQITIDSEALAYVRADFVVNIAENTVSHGVDHFTLVKTDSGWKVAAVAYTSIPGAPGKN
jgi:ketosteroid isomerase-like protein